MTINLTLVDLALPTDNVYYREGYYGTYYSSPGGWETTNLLLPINKKNSLATQMIGQIITLYLPIIDNKNQTLGYTFQFKVNGITPSK